MSKRKPSKQRRRRPTRTSTTLEDFSAEIFHEIFDYLSGNEVYKAFFDLNSRLNELVRNKSNLQLNLSRTKTRFYREFKEIYPVQHIRAIVLLYKQVGLLQTMFSSIDDNRLRSISLLMVPLSAFEKKIRDVLDPFRDQLQCLKIQFDDMCYTTPGALAAQSFAYLLTDFPWLKQLSLTYEGGIDIITYMPSNVTNTSIVNVTIALRDEERLIPLLHRFQKLKVLNLQSGVDFCRKRALPRDSILYYRLQLHEKTSIDYPMKVRQVNVYDCPMSLRRIERLLPHVILPNLRTLNLFRCQRQAPSHPIPRRAPPLLDGPEWTRLLQRSLPLTLDQFYLEYEDVDQTMSMTDVTRVKRELEKHSRSNTTWNVFCGHNPATNVLSFTFSPISNK